MSKVNTTKKMPATPKTAARPETGATSAEASGHIMISYQWGHQEIVKKIRDELTNRNFRVWFDKTHIKGDINDSMAEAVEGATAVLVCVSKAYSDSNSCKKESSYAEKRNKLIVPLMMERGYEPTGWLGLLLGNRLYIDFSGRYPFNAQMEELVQQLERLEVRAPGINPLTTTPPHTSSMDSQRLRVAGGGKELRTRVSGDEKKPGTSPVEINPLTATPRRTFFMDNQKLSVPGEKSEPRITCLAVTGGGRIVMADDSNKSVKVLDAGSPASISKLSLGVRPYSLAVCHDGLVAVTSYSDYVIHLIDVTGTPRVVRQIKTARQYWGVGCGGSDGTILVSCVEGQDRPAQLDVIKRDGTVVKTVVDSSTLPDLVSPRYLCVVDGQVLLSDYDAECVWRVDVAAGRLLAEHTDDQLKYPRQVTADRAGNVYVASGFDDSVLVMGKDGQWRTLLRGQEHGEGEYTELQCVALTGTRLIVGWSGFMIGSVLLGYELA